MKIVRLPDNPILRTDMDERMGGNINGPSLIRTPEWLESPLGRYYLYFANHGGKYIRLAFADELAGPWRVHTPGTLRLEQTFLAHHVASPDVHVDHDRQEIRMYFHGPLPGAAQVSGVALSGDGIDFEPKPEVLGRPYFRVFQWRGWYYALGMPGVFYRSRDGLAGFEEGPTLFTQHMRHSALRLGGNILSVFFSNAFDCPEHIIMCTIDLTPPWEQWWASEPVSVLEPETDYEGGDLPLLPSRRGRIDEPVRQLRDPSIFREDGRTWLLYSVAGEHGIAIAEILDA